MIDLWFLLLLFSLHITVIASQTPWILGDTVAPTSLGADTVLMVVRGQVELRQQGLKHSNPPCTQAGPRLILTNSPSNLCEGGQTQQYKYVLWDRNTTQVFSLIKKRNNQTNKKTLQKWNTLQLLKKMKDDRDQNWLYNLLQTCN